MVVSFHYSPKRTSSAALAVVGRNGDNGRVALKGGDWLYYMPGNDNCWSLSKRGEKTAANVLSTTQVGIDLVTATGGELLFVTIRSARAGKVFRGIALAPRDQDNYDRGDLDRNHDHGRGDQDRR